MPGDRLPLGIFTTNVSLVVRTWDAWMAEATGIDATQALNRPLTDVMPELEARGLLAIFENVLAQGTVEVLSPALHHYLFACAPSAPSGMFARMQQHITIGPLRDEGGIAGLIVTVEDATERIEQERRVATQLNDRGQDIASLTRELGEHDWRVRRRAVEQLAQQGNAIVDAFVQTLQRQHNDLGVLSSALDLLALSDIDVVEPLVRCLDADDVNLRIQAALILGERRDRRAIAPLIAHLDDPDMNVRFHAIEALGHLGATEAAERLAAIAEERDFFLAFPAIQTLTRVGTPAIAPRLVPLLADDLLRAPAIEALGELGDEDVAAPLVRLLNTAGAPTDVITDALSTLYERYESRYRAGEHIADLVRSAVTPAGTQQILDAVNRVGADRLQGLATVLGWLDGDAVQRALTRLLGHETVRSQVVEALVRYGTGVVALLTEQLHAEDLETRQSAAVALGRIGDRRATAALIAALNDRELAIVAAGALARIGDVAAFDALIDRLGDPDSAVRQSVIAALNSIGHCEMPRRIAALLDDPDPNVRESALKIAGYFGYAECVEQTIAACRDVSDSVRRTAVEQLPFFDDPRVIAPLLERIDDGSAAVRAAAVSACVRIDDASRIDALLRAVHDTDSWVRYAALKALSAIGARNALPAVVHALNHDPAVPVRLAAIEAIGRLDAPRALEVLAPLAQAHDDDIARAAIGALGHVDGPEAVTALERAARGSQRWQRLAAVDALARRLDTKVAEVLQWVAAADDDPDVVRAAVDALTRVGLREGERQGRSATHALIALTEEPARRQMAIAALGSLPPRRIEDVVAGLRHPSPHARGATVEALSRMRHPDASRAIESALNDPSPTVRLTAVAELKHLGTRACQGKLLALARTDPDAEVRHAAVMAIARTESRDELSR